MTKLINDSTLQEVRDFLQETKSGSWTINDFTKSGRCCALGHINRGVTGDPELGSGLGQKVIRVSRKFLAADDSPDFGLNIADVNDKSVSAYKQPSAKKRVLALLDDMLKDNVTL